MNEQDNRITISLEISVPINGEKPSVQIQQKGQLPWQQGTMAVQRPANNELWPVKTAGSGGTGVICAFGNANGASNAVKVSGQVGSGSPVETAIVSNFWKLDYIPGAVANASNLLTVRYFNSSGTEVLSELRPFMGVPSSQTFCEMVGGSGSGGGGFGASLHTKCVYLPVSLQVPVDGFSDELSCFNGDWVLQIVPAAAESKSITWRCGDRRQGPEVELTANTDDRSAVLRFINQVTEVRYHKEQGCWNPANICEFSNVSSTLR